MIPILMGCYRLFLSYLVVLSHLQISPFGINSGVVAVISFLILSGYVMTALVERYYLSRSQVIPFYADRMIRLFPQFIFYSLVTLLAVLFGLKHQWISRVPSMPSILAQLTMLPLNLYTQFPDMLLPQAWSLGLELTFYAVIPLVLLLRIRLQLAIASFVVFFLAYLGILDADWFAYRLLFGTFFIFMLGSWIYRSDRRFGQIALLAVSIICAIMLLIGNTDMRDVLLGIVIGIPAVHGLASRAFGRIDGLAGDLSYGVFLNHNLVIMLLAEALGVPPAPLLVALTLVVATSLSFLSFRYLEKPLIHARRRMRRVTNASTMHFGRRH